MIFRKGTGRYDFFEHDIESKIRNEQNKVKDATLNKLMSEHISIGDGSAECSFVELRKAIARKCSDAKNLAQATNDFLDSLYVTINETAFALKMPLFPKGNERRQIEIHIEKHKIVTRISTKALPDSIVNYLVALSEWMPEYAAIEERIRTEEEKKRIACTIAYNAFEKIVEEKLKGKGYKYFLKKQRYDNTAVLRINSGKSIEMTFEVKLLEDFVERISAILEALPIFTSDLADCNDGQENESDDFLEDDGFADGFGEPFIDNELFLSRIMTIK